ncbi:MAG: hypothetical protein S4CHLAM2_07010 [Chlamydiales bacterium]|nr:hypothetical protein [Chlamydiales bacterium]
MRILALCALALLFVGCQRLPLDCRSEYLYPEYLASEQVLTPDPFRLCFYGQQVIVYWNLPGRCHPTELRLHVRYGTREQTTLSWPIDFSKGYRIYRLINEEYWCHEGIVSFKAELYENENLIIDWAHHLWTDIIQLNEAEGF